MKDQLFVVARIFHIAGGTLGLVFSIAALSVAKGSRIHKFFGKIFFWSMVSASLASFVLSVLHENQFLFIIGVFTLYLILSGRRMLRLKQIDALHKASNWDWLLSIAMGLFAVGFVVMGIRMIVLGRMFGIVPLVFGLGSLSAVREDIQYFRGLQPKKMFWYYQHMTRMIGGTIATYTAFLVVNNTMLPDLVVWLGPAFIGSILISFWRRKKQIEFEGVGKISE